MEVAGVLAQVDGAVLVGGCIGLVVGLTIGVLIGAIILRQATIWVTKITLGYGRACLLVLATGVFSFIVNFVMGFGIGLVGGMARMDPQLIQTVAGGLGLVVGFFVSSASYGYLIKYPDGVPAVAMVPTGVGGELDYASTNPLAGTRIGFAKGMLVTLVQYLIVLGIVVLVLGLVLVAARAMR